MREKSFYIIGIIIFFGAMALPFPRSIFFIVSCGVLLCAILARKRIQLHKLTRNISDFINHKAAEVIASIPKDAGEEVFVKVGTEAGKKYNIEKLFFDAFGFKDPTEEKISQLIDMIYHDFFSFSIEDYSTNLDAYYFFMDREWEENEG